jgi:hypothetical protein
MKHLLVCLAFLVPTIAAHAQQPPSSGHIAAALTLVRTLNLEQLLQTMAESHAPPGLRREIMARVLKQRVNVGAFENLVATLYAEAFTEPELRQLTDFYSTPLGRKLSATQVTLSRRVLQSLSGAQEVVSNLVVSACAAASVSVAAEQHQKLQISMGKPSPTTDEVLAATGPLLARAEESCSCIFEKARAAVGPSAGANMDKLFADPRAKAAMDEAVRTGACPRPL